jgi:hypothetical protein
MFYRAEFALPHLVSLVLSSLLLLAALQTPRFARHLFELLFAWACVVNWTTVMATPRVYLEYAPLALLHVYREIILGPFARHIHAAVGVIATCQGLIVLGLLLGDIWARIALCGAIFFLVDIAPLGVGAAFPATLLMAAAAGVLLTRSRWEAISPSIWELSRAARDRASHWRRRSGSHAP